MIILDTNIISELMKSTPSWNVIGWLDQQNNIELHITTITIAEISYGLNVLPTGKRRIDLENKFNKSIMTSFKYRMLSFDESAAHIYGKIMSNRKQIGSPMSLPDGQIAAIAHSKNAILATRNVRDFANCELEVINPFEKEIRRS